MMKYGIAVFPEKQVQDAADGWRARHDPNYCNIPAHMTIREAEEWSDGQLATAIEQLDAAAALTAPFRISFNRVSSFYPVSNVLYLALEDPAPMIRLHENVCNGPLAIQARRYVYTPHVTLAQQLSDDELHDLYGNWRMSKIDLTTTIDRIHLLYQTEKGSWTAYQTFLLKG